MTYVALGDSISIDLYTEVEGGGAAAQLARLLNADEFIDRTRDGMVSQGVLEELRFAQLNGIPSPDAVTLTIGGNDILSGYYFREIGQRNADRIAFDPMRENLVEICQILAEAACPVVVNTIYDPTDGDDSRAVEIGLPLEAREALSATNRLIRALAKAHRFRLCDLELLFRGHGFWSADPWIVMHIEPNLEGATQIAREWHRLLSSEV